MNWSCLLGHQWSGCRCERCGQVRDQDHDWHLAQCRRSCRRCGLVKELSHDWEQCRCRQCGATRHTWSRGVCQRCAEHCPHPESAQAWRGESDATTAHAPLAKVCQRCGQELA
ncbi:MAG: hypothetical protein FJ387_12900 [Verrucomicrobia bacterium]|nr:hypothetical protein [Verrucomicrobiota bacterium]